MLKNLKNLLILYDKNRIGTESLISVPTLFSLLLGEVCSTQQCQTLLSVPLFGPFP